MFPFLNIQVDGGITMENIEEVASAGANFIVSGSSIVSSSSQKNTIQFIRECVKKFTK